MADAHSNSHACKHCGALFARPAPGVRNNAQYCSVACRFWSKVDKSGGADACWPWTAGRMSFGYGTFGLRSNVIWRSHRVAYVLTFGEIQDGLCVCHKCDNPSCCNPAHYFLGTHQDNMVDMHSKGRNAMTPDGLERLKASKRGRPRSAEVREKLSLALRGRTMPKEVVEKVAASHRGKKRSEETKNKMRAAWERRRERDR